MNIKIFLPLILAFLIAQNSFAQNSSPHISVSGEAVIYTAPEIANASIPLKSKDVSYSVCSDKLLAMYANLSKALVKAGFDEKEIKANRINITEDISYQSRERVKLGYVGSMSLELKMDMSPENMGKLVNVLGQDEFSFGYSIGFELSEKQKKELEAQAISQAVSQAKINAELIAEAAELRLGSILKIEYGTSSPNYGPLVMKAEGARMMDQNSSPELNMNTKEIEIRKHVDIVWDILPPYGKSNH